MRDVFRVDAAAKGVYIRITFASLPLGVKLSFYPDGLDVFSFVWILEVRYLFGRLSIDVF